jgi:hypothetical protein
MKEKTLRINNLDKLSHSEHREITPFVNVIKTFHRNEFETGIHQYEIYLERLGVIPPNVLQLNINPTIKVNESKLLSGKTVKSGYVEVEFQSYINTSIASTTSPKSCNVKVGIESLKTLEDFKEYLKSIISLFFK